MPIKRILCLIFLLNIPLWLLCQKNEWRMGALAYLNFSSGIPEKGGVNATYFRGIDSQEFSFSIGAKIALLVDKNWSLHTGILYGNRSDRSKLVPADSLSFEPYVIYTKVWQAELPLNIEYTFDNKFFISTGASLLYNQIPNIRMGNTSTMTTYEKAVPLSEGEMKKLNGSATASVGYKIPVNGSLLALSISSQYSFQHDFISLGEAAKYSPLINFISTGIKVEYLF